MLEANDKKVSVVICTYGGRERCLRSCIESLKNQTHQSSETILVVDTEEEKERYSTDYPDVRVISSKKKGLAAARNRGIEASTGDIIAFIDDDAVADKNWVSEIMRSFNSDNVMAVGGPVRPILQGKKIKEKLNWIVGCTSTNPPTERPIGCNMAIDRRIFNEVGLFNEALGRVKEKLSLGEETELFLRIKKHKPDANIVFNPGAVVYHDIPKERTKLGYILRRAYEEGLAKAIIGRDYELETERTYLRYYLKHLDLTTFLVLLSTGVGYIRGKFWI